MDAEEMNLSNEQIEINQLCCLLAAKPRDELERELRKLPQEKIARILMILSEHINLLTEGLQNG